MVRDETSMPSQDRLGLDEEGCLAAAAEHASGGGDERPVGGFEARSRHLTVQHRELMS